MASLARIVMVRHMPVLDQIIKGPDGDLSVRTSSGSGLPILMLHGSGASKAVFEKQFGGVLADRFRLIAMDLPGHGASANAGDPRATYGITGLGRAAVAVLDALQVPRALVFGWSLGGHVAIEMLAAVPERVAGLMLTGAPPVSRGPLGMLRGFHARWDLLLASKENYSAHDVERFAQLCFGAATTPALEAGIVRADGRARVEFSRSLMRGEGADQRRTVETAMMPVAIVNGAEEPIARLGYFNSLDIPTLWDGKCKVLAGAGHSPFWQVPEAFNRLLTGFAIDVADHERVAPLVRASQQVARSA